MQIYFALIVLGFVGHCICFVLPGEEEEESSFPIPPFRITIQNGGTCFFRFAGCNCPPGTYGDVCEIELCVDAEDLCQNGGTCTNNARSAGYTCVCPFGIYGENCEHVTEADTILYGGDIITMEETSAEAKIEAVAISGDTILAVGTMNSVFNYKGDKTEVIFLNQQTLMPGFIEPHHHAAENALVYGLYTNVGGLNTPTYKQVKEVMDNRIGYLIDHPKDDEWAIFFGWDPELVYDLPDLSAKFLDGFNDTIPIVVIGQSEHVAWANTPALEAAGIGNGYLLPADSDGEVVLDIEGNATGKLFEVGAITLVLKEAPLPGAKREKKVQEAFREQFRHYTTVGLTTVTEMAYTPEMNESLINATDAPDAPVRVALYRLITNVSDAGGEELTDGLGDYSSMLFEVGLKLIADGSPHCGTSAIRQPYMYTPLTDALGFPKEPDYGKLNYENEALHETIKQHHANGTQFAIHCHGERVSDQVLKIFEQVLTKNPNPDVRHRMDHLGMTTVEQIERAGKINVTLTFFVDQLRLYGDTFKNDIFGERVNRWAAVSAASKNNIKWTIHQDHPAFPGQANPFASMKTAVTRCLRNHTTPYGPEYRVSIHEALKAYTVNAAWQLHLEDKIGSIVVGKKADLVVLSDNPYHVDPFELEDIQVIDTYVGGRRNNLANITTIPNVDVQVLEREN